MLKQMLLVSILLFSQCGHKGNTDDKAGTHADADAAKTKAALAFINAYVAHEQQSGEHGYADEIAYVNGSKLVTQNFKISMKRVINEGYKTDSIMGLDADAVLDAQYIPEKGFEFDRFNRAYIILKGVGMPEFKLTVKVVEENGVWLVDGCGMVNVPEKDRVRG